MRAQRDFNTDLALLGISESDVNSLTTEEFHALVKSARKAKLREWHPDVCSDERAVEMSAEINAAADALLTVGPLEPPSVVIIRDWDEFVDIFGRHDDVPVDVVFTSTKSRPSADERKRDLFSLFTFVVNEVSR